MSIKTDDGNILCVGFKGDWAKDLALAIQDIATGKELIVDSDAKRELALRAIERMRPGDQITVTIQ